MATLRLQKFLAQCGIASRRKSEQLIQQGKISVNAKTVRDVGISIDPYVDEVCFKGTILKPQQKIYLMLNKPKGYISTSKDTHRRQIVLNLIPKEFGRLFCVGRLDKDSEGLLLLTNDGQLAHRLIHPKFGVLKTYEVIVEGIPKDSQILKLENGLMIEGKRTSCCIIKRIGMDKANAKFEIKMHEGRKRQIRLMFSSISYKVKSLKRMKYGPIALGNVREGCFRKLFDEEVQLLKKETGLS